MADKTGGRKLEEQQKRVPGSLVVSPHEIQRGWLIVEALLLVTVMLLFNYLPDRVGIFTNEKNPSTLVPLLAPGFADCLLWLNLWLGLALNVNVLKLIHGRWHSDTRWADLGLSLFGVFVLFRIVAGRAMVTLNPAWASAQVAAGVSVAQIEQQLVPLLSASIKVTLTIALIGLALASLQKLVLLIKHLHPKQVRRRSQSTTG